MLIMMARYEGRLLLRHPGMLKRAQGMLVAASRYSRVDLFMGGFLVWGDGCCGVYNTVVVG